MGSEIINVVGLGYVGLPVAVAFAKKYKTYGVDINKKRVEELQSHFDRTNEVTSEELKSSQMTISDDIETAREATFHIITVPTPIDRTYRPDLRAVVGATESVGKVLKKGDVVVYESTVYPGLTRERCFPLLEKFSGLKAGRDFKVGYSPERINPGDKEHRFETILKVVSGMDEESCDRVADVYGSVVTAGVFKAASIEAAEAAKVIENTQRDLNVALINELALIFDRMNLDTMDVLDAASTKWNFLKFTPGLVGGHCIGVDPYYLTHRAEQLGYDPQVILAGRKINNGMGPFVASKTMKMLAMSGVPIRGAKVGLFGLTFKENCPDIRNSRSFDIASELLEYGVELFLTDPLADPDEVKEETGFTVTDFKKIPQLDAAVFAVKHSEYQNLNLEELQRLLSSAKILVDVKSCFSKAVMSDFGASYWRL